MPYARNAELPTSVRLHLPPAAQTLYRKAFNAAWRHYAEAQTRRADASREETAHRVAWSAVKKSYVKRGNRWVKSSGRTPARSASVRIARVVRSR